MALSPEMIEQMEAAALLPDDDPQREVVLRIIGEQGPEARQYWLDLLRSDERLRLDLFAVPMPPALAEKLLAIPEAPGRAVRTAGVSISRRSLSWAALVFLMAGLAYYIYPSIRAYDFKHWQDEQLKELAVWAVENHISTPPGAVESADPAVIRAAFAPAHMPIQTPIFSAAAGARLLGGGATSVHGQPVVFTRWASGDAHYTLYEFMPKQLGLDPDFSPRNETPRQLWTDQKHYVVELWSQEGYQCGWLLVKESPEASSPFKVTY